VDELLCYIFNVMSEAEEKPWTAGSLIERRIAELRSKVWWDKQ
jgi:hypothetical protein